MQKNGGGYNGRYMKFFIYISIFAGSIAFAQEAEETLHTAEEVLNTEVIRELKTRKAGGIYTFSGCKYKSSHVVKRIKTYKDPARSDKQCKELSPCIATLSCTYTYRLLKEREQEGLAKDEEYRKDVEKHGGKIIGNTLQLEQPEFDVKAVCETYNGDCPKDADLCANSEQLSVKFSSHRPKNFPAPASLRYKSRHPLRSTGAVR